MTKLSISKIKEIFNGRRCKILGARNEFSILAPLVDVRGELNLLYEVRSKSLKRQPGEVCFPGGQIEIGESPKSAAIRETCEELLVEKENVSIIAPLDPIFAPSNFTMYTYLGEIQLENPDKIKFSKDEVDELFLVPLEFFMETKPEQLDYSLIPEIGPDFPYEKIGFPDGYKWRKGLVDLPVYNYKGRIIWGLTGRITKNIAEILSNDCLNK